MLSPCIINIVSYQVQGVFLYVHFKNLNNSNSIRPIFINLGSKCVDYIKILIHTTHIHIIILFFEMPSLILKNYFQSSTEVPKVDITIPSDTSWNAEVIVALMSLVFS